jgi:SAM-dependent methyltransferase
VSFVVPPRFIRNSTEVLEMGPPADIGVQLLGYLCQRLGLESLEGLDLLDFGCGTRFADSLMNRHVKLRSYTGIDIDPAMVRWLAINATDPRLEFHLFDAYNAAYHPTGKPMTVDTVLPVGGRTFDVMCMLSVITHQAPDDARAIFAMLRRHVRRDGKLFFSAFLDDEMAQDYREGEPEHPTLYSFYSPDYLRRLLAETGWRVASLEPGHDELPIVNSFYCVPA